MTTNPGQRLVRDIINNNRRRVDFDLDNWINDFEDGFTRFTKINPQFKEHYWGQGFSNRPRIKELNEQIDAQRVEGYRVVEFFPDREIEDESYILFGTPLELMTQISFIMNMRLMIQRMDFGVWLGYPVDEYLRQKPRVGITAQIILTTYASPPFYSRGTKWFSRRQVTIPMVDKSKLTYSALRQACNGSAGQNWGEWVARAYVGFGTSFKGLSQIVAGGSTENAAKTNLEKFLPFTQCPIHSLTVNKIDYSVGERAKDPDRNRYNSFNVYPAWVSILNSKLIAIDDARKDAKRTVSGKMLSKRNKLFLYMDREPSYWKQQLNDVIQKSFAD